VFWSNYGLNGFISLPLNYKTSVRIDSTLFQLRLFLNNTLDTFVSFSTSRYFGTATLYVSDPWCPAGPASIYSIRMTTLPYVNSSSFNGPLIQFGVYDAVYVPYNFNLTFDIFPTAVSSVLTNILHFTQDGSDASRVPGMIFCIILFFSCLFCCWNHATSSDYFNSN